MLDRYVVYGTPSGGSVWFKYLSRVELEAQQRSIGDRDQMSSLYEEISRGGMVGGGDRLMVLDGIQTDLRKWGKLESYKALHVDLGTNNGHSEKLYRAYLRAARAAELAVDFFQTQHSAWSWRRRLSRSIRNRYFGKASGEHVQTIIDVFQRTSTGLHQDGIVISDNAGRDMMQGHIEGIVKFKPGTQAAANAEARGLNPTERQELMGKYLQEGETYNIRMEFSKLREYSVDQFARALLHEATHKFGWTSDYAYEENRRGFPLMPAQAVKNADSYAYAGMSVLLGRLVTHGTLQ